MSSFLGLKDKWRPKKIVNVPENQRGIISGLILPKSTTAEFERLLHIAILHDPEFSELPRRRLVVIVTNTAGVCDRNLLFMAQSAFCCSAST